MSKPSNHDRRILIVGDSITHGNEGDYTWRYRLWQWFRLHNIPGTFVGPYRGVNAREPAEAPHPPPFANEPEPQPPKRQEWGYAEDVDQEFQSGCRHFATWGYQAAQAKEVIADVVSDSRANFLLLMLGFNDVGWFVDDADGTLRSIEQIVQRTRVIQPKMQFAIANIVHRTFMQGREDLVEKTNRFNELLKEAVRKWNEEGSRVVEVNVAALYQCGPTYEDRTPAAYDGLHPNAFGEYEIAQAFSKALHGDFGLGAAPLGIPDDIPKRNLSTPENIVAEGSPMGVKVTWDQVHGAEYRIRHRRVGDTEWSDFDKHNNRHDINFIEAGSKWQVCLRSCHGYDVGEWSKLYTATAATMIVPAPENIKSQSTTSGFRLAWDPPDAEQTVTCYEIAWKDNDAPALWFSGSQSVSGTSAIIDGISIGHSISIWIRPWRKVGDEWAAGNYHAARPVRVGGHSPQRPTGVEVNAVDNPNRASITWNGSDCCDAGYLVYVRDLTKWGSSAETNGQVVRETTYQMECERKIWEYEFSVSAVNGDEESRRSSGVIPSRDGK